MVYSLQELQEFILWCKANGVKRTELGSIKFELSDYALLQHVPEYATDNVDKSASKSTDTMVDTAEQVKEDEDLLYWSSKT